MFKNKGSKKSDSKKASDKRFGKGKSADLKKADKKNASERKNYSSFKKHEDSKTSEKSKFYPKKEFKEAASLNSKRDSDFGKDLYSRKKTTPLAPNKKTNFAKNGTENAGKKPFTSSTKTKYGSAKSGKYKDLALGKNKTQPIEYERKKSFVKRIVGNSENVTTPIAKERAYSAKTKAGIEKKSTYSKSTHSAGKDSRNRSYSPYRKNEEIPADKFLKSKPVNKLQGKQKSNFRDDADFELEGLTSIENQKFRAIKKKLPKSLKNILKKSTSSELGEARLNKIIANAGICSRREADEFITAGLVKVNGKVVSELGHKVKISDIVTYHGETVKREKPVYYLMNKPKDFITTTNDPQNRKTVMALIAGIKERIYPVGRLDRNTTGVLLFTNDGELTKKLTHPSFEVKKIYHVFLDKQFKKEDMDKLREGVMLHDGFIKPDDVSYVAGSKSKNEVGIELHSGKNRIVRRIFEHLGYAVDKLDRVYFAGITKKDLSRGDWRELTEREISNLKSL